MSRQEDIYKIQATIGNLPVYLLCIILYNLSNISICIVQCWQQCCGCWIIWMQIKLLLRYKTAF